MLFGKKKFVNRGLIFGFFEGIIFLCLGVCTYVGGMLVYQDKLSYAEVFKLVFLLPPRSDY